MPRHYARILVDIDLSKIAYDEIIVERDGFSFKLVTKKDIPRQHRSDKGAST